VRADQRGHTADDKSERSNPASGQPDLRDKLVLCKYKKALRLQPGLATGFVRVNAHHPATGVPACRVSGFPFCAFCLCGSER
jgi:hypothetical protein